MYPRHALKHTRVLALMGMTEGAVERFYESLSKQTLNPAPIDTYFYSDYLQPRYVDANLAIPLVSLTQFTRPSRLVFSDGIFKREGMHFVIQWMVDNRDKGYFRNLEFFQITRHRTSHFEVSSNGTALKEAIINDIRIMCADDTNFPKLRELNFDDNAYNSWNDGFDTALVKACEGITPKKRTAPVIKARMQSDRPITICAGVSTTLNPNYWYYDMTNPAEVAQCRFSWNWELFDESSRYAIGPYPNRNTPYCEYDYPKPPENCNSAHSLIIARDSDCSKLYNRGWKSITINEGLCNSMTGELSIYENPCLESIVIKKNSLKNSNGLYILRNPQLSSIVVETGDWDTSACRSVRSLTLSSIFYLMSI